MAKFRVSYVLKGALIVEAKDELEAEKKIEEMDGYELCSGVSELPGIEAVELR